MLGHKMADLNKNQQDDSIDNILNRIRSEVTLAHSVENGYLRRFQIPKTVMDDEFSLTVDDIGWVIIEYHNTTYSKAMPQPMVGGLCFNDTNLNYINLSVSKDADLVSLSSCTDCSYSYAVCMNAERNNWCNWLSQPAMFPGFNETCCSDHCKCC